MGKKVRKISTVSRTAGYWRNHCPGAPYRFRMHGRHGCGHGREWEMNRYNIVRADMERYGECWLEVYKHFGIDLKDPDAEARLLRALVSADPSTLHRRASKKGWPADEVGNADTITLLAEIARISSTESERSGVMPSESHLAKKLSHTSVCKTKRLGEHRIRAPP